LVVLNSSVGKWFIRKRGLAIGISAMGISFGTILLTPASGYIVKNYDWQMGFIFLGIIVFLIGISLSQLLLKKISPETYGLLPDGESNSNKVENAVFVNGNMAQMSVGKMFRDIRFWVMVICYSLAVMTLMAVLVHQVAYALDSNIEKVAAAASLGVVGIGGFCGQFFFGWLTDRLKDVKYSAFLGIIIMAIGMVLLLKASTVQSLYLYALTYGFGYGSLAPMMPILVADRFGRHVLGSVYGMLTFFIGIEIGRAHV
jgi:sugar phosphate permease